MSVKIIIVFLNFKNDIVVFGLRKCVTNHRNNAEYDHAFSYFFEG